MSDETPAPPSPKQLHIADRMKTLREEIRHFGNTAAVASVPAEKEQAAARVEVARALLATLEKL